jgi:hypothetical protein
MAIVLRTAQHLSSASALATEADLVGKTSLPTSVWINMGTRPLGGDPFYGLQQVARRYSISRNKFVINRPAHDVRAVSAGAPTL